MRKLKRSREADRQAKSAKRPLFDSLETRWGQENHFEAGGSMQGATADALKGPRAFDPTQNLAVRKRILFNPTQLRGRGK
jgi:hypothetical protein